MFLRVERYEFIRVVHLENGQRAHELCGLPLELRKPGCKSLTKSMALEELPKHHDVVAAATVLPEARLPLRKKVFCFFIYAQE